jgi:hypothetical protein
VLVKKLNAYVVLAAKAVPAVIRVKVVGLEELYILATTAAAFGFAGKKLPII